MSILAFNPFMLVFSTLLILGVCYGVNLLFAKIYNAPTNSESYFITALILALIITPPTTLSDINYLLFIIFASVLAMASKYILAIGKKHIFNPAAIAVAITALTIGQSATWWVGTASMAPFVLVGGLLITRKIKRFDLVLSFIGIFLLSSIIIRAHGISDIVDIVWNLITTSPLLFFSFIMLTEPLTTPPTQGLRMGYGAFLGAIFSPLVHIGNIYSTPELALLVGNIFSYIVSPKKKLILKLKEKTKIAEDTYDFAFKEDTQNTNYKFTPGQYLEWTLAHKNSDTRGNRRYFTIASSPEEKEVRIGVKFYPESSTFKKALLSMQKDEVIVASQLAGDFTLPKDTNQKLCFIAGGIGITPFESIVNDLLEKKETKQKRNIVMFYSNRTIKDIAYANTFERARKELNMNTIYSLSDEKSIPKDWAGDRGFITMETIKSKLQDYKDRMFYISGPHSMVEAFEQTLKELGIPKSHIKIDYFPGFA